MTVSSREPAKFDQLLAAMLGVPASRSQPLDTEASDAERDED